MEDGDISNETNHGVLIDVEGFVLSKIQRSGISRPLAGLVQVYNRVKHKTVWPPVYSEITGNLFSLDTMKRYVSPILGSPEPDGSYLFRAQRAALSLSGVIHPLISYAKEKPFHRAAYLHNLLWAFLREDSPVPDWIRFGGRVRVVRWSSASELYGQLQSEGLVATWSRSFRVE